MTIYAKNKIAISDEFATSLVLEAKIQSLQVSNKHFEVEVLKKKVKIKAKNSNTKDAQLVVYLSNKRKITFYLFFSREKAKPVLNLIPRINQKHKKGNFEANFQKLLSLPNNIYVSKKLGHGKVTLHAFFWVQGTLYLKMILPSKSAEVEALDKKEEYVSMISEEKIIKNKKIVLLKLRKIKFPLKLVIYDSEKEEETKIELKKL